ncbi:Glucan endo-1,3-beta-D-glucosidase [Bertholletia excelsa]
MPLPGKISLFLWFLSLSLLISKTNSLPASIGVNYRPTMTTPPPDRVAAALQSLKIAAVRIPGDSEPAAIRAFSYTNISILLSVPNRLVPAIASNRSAAELWLYTHVVPFYPRAPIAIISVGTDVASAASDLTDLLLPAVRNVHFCLRDLGLRRISVSSTFSFLNVMTTAFPPSSAEFQEPLAGVIIKPLLQFLAETNSSFLINLHPYSVYRLNREIPIGYTLFQEQQFNFRDDIITGVRYRNLFDVMVDAVISAMTVAGHESIPLVVTETGWPSSGGPEEPEASQIYAEMYVKGLIDHLKSGLGTPLRKEGVAQTYIYELFDGDPNHTSEPRQWGLLYQNMTKKYNIDFSAGSRIDGGILAALAAAFGFLFAVSDFLVC